MDGMTSAVLLMALVLDTTDLEMAIIIMMTGPVIDTTIGPIIVMGIVGAMRVGTARMVGNLSVILLLEDLAMRSSMVLGVDPGGRGLKDVLVGVGALLLQDPVPVVWLSGFQVFQLSDCLVVWLSGCLLVWLPGCLVVWLFGCLVVCLSSCPVVLLSGCLVVWLSDGLFVWLSGCLVASLSGCLVV